ncbi:NAD(P)/FAD-dependent oxidoreductase [Aquimarina sp. W85]|uniref:NAD(P)/FAD-dependent oxidoreductase n=1 Tax=Aquimarina rhodophyticola TaxID=3342246 RepID=UPI00366C1EDA
MVYDVIVVGGGAAGFFTAINAVQKNPNLKIAILERGKEVLSKVRISGGGRCNVTHAEFIPNDLARNYPRGEKELKGPFHTFMTGDTMAWFEERGVPLKIEEDGRVFPVSNTSESIINCFLSEAKSYAIEIKTNHSVKSFEKSQGSWRVTTSKGLFKASYLVVATGSNPKIWTFLEQQFHKTIAPVPSLFTFNSKDKRIVDLPGVATTAAIKLRGSKLRSEGPVLITHWGLSGPAILKLSAWGAIELHTRNYKFEIEINWLCEQTYNQALAELQKTKLQHSKQYIYKYAQFDLPKRLWRSLVVASGISEQTRWADLTKEQLKTLVTQLTSTEFKIDGKSTFKDEFVTAGGIVLQEINFKTFESKVQKNLFFVGEVLNIDAITGGFNFQNAWTSGYIAANTLAKKSLGEL